MRILVDSDVLVDHLRGHQRFEPGRDLVHYSTVTRAELSAGRGTEEQKVRRLLAPFVELSVDRAVAERAGRLRRKKSIRLPDALIAATAAEHRLFLVTRNARDFARLPGVRTRLYSSCITTAMIGTHARVRDRREPGSAGLQSAG